jgi:hypothetical protein
MYFKKDYLKYGIKIIAAKSLTNLVVSSNI